MKQNFRFDWGIYPYLKEAFNDNSHYVTIPAGRRSGKTFNSVIWLCTWLLKEKMAGLWVDTTQGNIEKYVDRYFRPILGDLFRECGWDRQKKVLTFPNESYIDFGSAERPENLEGFGYARAVINEGGLVLRKPNLWYNSVQPMVKDSNCQVKIIGTPKGKNVFHELYVSGREGNSEYASYHYPASKSPNWTQAELDQIKKKVPALVYQQEYEAEFLEGEGMVFRGIKEVVRDMSPDYKEGHEYILGIDLAKHQDFTVIAVLDKATHEIVFLDRFNEISWTFQKSRIKNIWERYGKGQIILDSTGVGDSIYDDLVSAGIRVKPFRFNNTNKQEIVINLAVAIENREIWLPRDENMIDELSIYEYDVTPMGNVRYTAPEGFHDDIVMALCLAWSGVKATHDILIGTF
jgi:phage FluMu gp28-like protein